MNKKPGCLVYIPGMTYTTRLCGDFNKPWNKDPQDSMESRLVIVVAQAAATSALGSQAWLGWAWTPFEGSGRVVKWDTFWGVQSVFFDPRNMRIIFWCLEMFREDLLGFRCWFETSYFLMFNPYFVFGEDDPNCTDTCVFGTCFRWPLWTKWYCICNPGGGNSKIFYVHPETWGRWTHFDLRIFFKWVETQPPTNQQWNHREWS